MMVHIRKAGFLAALMVGGAQMSALLSPPLPRTRGGRPDLQGTWTNATATPFERPPELADKEFFTEAEAAVWERGSLARRERNTRDAATSGEITEEWVEFGKVLPSRRTSIIVDPRDGRIPYTAEGRSRAQALLDRHADHPEQRNPAERCLLGVAPDGDNTGGPPMLPAYFNSLTRIVQTADSLMILAEMVHDARIIRIDGRHAPPSVRQWMGDSTGRWEGDVLVVDTTNFPEGQSFRGSAAGLRVVERFTLVDASLIRYQFTVDDPSAFTRPWS